MEQKIIISKCSGCGKEIENFVDVEFPTRYCSKCSEKLIKGYEEDF